MPAHPISRRARVALPGAEIPAPPRYRVFLSYSHADTAWARWLMRRLENYAVPRRFRGRTAPIGEVGTRLAPVFRDRDELPTTNDLGETIRQALCESATLVVICSPASARSRWVREEILTFKRVHGESHVFAFIVDGEPKAEGAADDCFSPALRQEVGADGGLTGRPAEVVAADARAEADGRKLAFLRLVAGLLGVGFDELRQRDLQRRNRRLMVITAAAVAGMALTLALAVTARQARNDARRRQDQAEDVLAFMLGGFRDELKKLGQLPLLEKVGDKAVGYFESLDPRDLTETALARQAKALTQIGEVRMLQKDVRYADAARVFFTAHQAAAALAERHPDNGNMVFERAQAEYWIGYVHWRRHQLPQALTWMTRYRDSSLALVAIDPAHAAWRKELFFAHKNLAALDVDYHRFAEAQAGFLAARQTCEQLLATNPGDFELRFSLADTESWLGNVAERRGDLAAAANFFLAEVRRVEEFSAADPKNKRWQSKLADALVLEAGILAVTGDTAAAVARLQRAQSIQDPLAVQDRTNRQWQRFAASIRFHQAELLATHGEAAAAARLATEARTGLESTLESSDSRYVQRLAAALSLEARLVEAPQAMACAERAVQLGESVVQAAPDDDAALGRLVQACVVAGHLAARDGVAAARLRWQHAVDVAEARARNSTDWRLLDPTARALAALGRLEESRTMIARLTRSGYRPLEPWPNDAAMAANFVRDPNPEK